MIRGLYSAAGGMQAMSLQQDATSHNLSHAMKPGFRREILQFDSIGQQQDIIAPSTSLHTDFTPGIHEYTGSKFDVALDGPGFFAVEGPSGTLYTRSGVFQPNGAGQLVTPDGLRVLGDGGPISIPLDSDLNRVEITPDGSIVVGGGAVAQLKVSSFDKPEQLERVGSSYFQASPDTKATESEAEVRQGYRELGNTTVVQEMVQMLAGARLFEATQKALTQIADTIALNTRPK